MIKKLLIYLLPLCLLAYILAHFFFTQKTNSYSHSPEVQAAINPFIEDKEIAGIVSILSDPDYNLTIDCFGYADAENRRPMTPDTVFAIFSMTKTVTGCAIMIALDQHILSLDDPVAKYLPEFKDLPYQVTIKDCMTHMSGLTGANIDIVKRSISLREAARKTAQESHFSSPPQTSFSYANPPIDVAAACLEVASNIPFDQFLQKYIFDPLDMRDTTFEPTPDMISRMAKSYSSDTPPFRPAQDVRAKQLQFPSPHKVYPCASAGLFSTPQDMIKFSQMLAHHGKYKDTTIVSSNTFDSIWAKKQTPPHIQQPYTIGSWLYQDWFGHEGALRTDQRANLKIGHSRLFFIQTENKAGQSFFNAKKAWHTACDKVQGMEVPFEANN